MKIQTALLPHKHIKFSDSIIALAGFLRTLLEEPKSIDDLWIETLNQWVTKVTFTHLVLAIDVLFAIKQIESVSNGRLIRVVK